MDSDRSLGVQASKRWWEQAGMELAGTWEADMESEGGETGTDYVE